jgi:membrane dipeptidase
MLKSGGFGVLSAVVLLAGCQQLSWRPQDKALWNRADELAHKYMIVDTHMDAPSQLQKKMEDVSQETSGDFDYPRAVTGGLDVAFMAVYVSPKYEEDGVAKAFADETIDLVEGIAKAHSDKFAMAGSPQDAGGQFGKGKVTIVMGMENGAPIEGDLDNLRHFYDRGIRYITLAHSKCNHICDSSYDKERKWRGLSPFGRELVVEMNRTGMIIDVSHVSDETFYQVMELSRAPVVATHSSCRHFTPGWERNMDDEMIKLLAEKGGIIQITFGGMFVNTRVHRKSQQAWEVMDAYIARHNLQDEARDKYVAKYKKAHPIGKANVTDVAEHIDHAVKLVGIDHVGLGSDFDGVDNNVPIGLEDASCYPNLIYELLKRGYSEQDIKKICAENFLRVWSAIQGSASK